MAGTIGFSSRSSTKLVSTGATGAALGAEAVVVAGIAGADAAAVGGDVSAGWVGGRDDETAPTETGAVASGADAAVTAVDATGADADAGDAGLTADTAGAAAAAGAAVGAGDGAGTDFAVLADPRGSAMPGLEVLAPPAGAAAVAAWPVADDAGVVPSLLRSLIFLLSSATRVAAS